MLKFPVELPPLQMTEANERRVRSYKKGKNKKKGKDGEFSVTEEGITEVVGKLIGFTNTGSHLLARGLELG